MSEKAGDIIKDALTEIVVLGAEAPLEAVDAQAAIRYMNRMMAGLDAKGIDLGYTEVTSTADDITVPAGAIEGMVFLLAARLWNQYAQGDPLPQLLIANAASGMKAMRAIAVTVGASEYPDTLPIGSGNEGGEGQWTTHFYEDLEADILAETTGAIGLESATV